MILDIDAYLARLGICSWFDWCNVESAETDDDESVFAFADDETDTATSDPTSTETETATAEPLNAFPLLPSSGWDGSSIYSNVKYDGYLFYSGSDGSNPSKELSIGAARLNASGDGFERVDGNPIIPRSDVGLGGTQTGLAPFDIQVVDGTPYMYVAMFENGPFNIGMLEGNPNDPLDWSNLTTVFNTYYRNHAPAVMENPSNADELLCFFSYAASGDSYNIGLATAPKSDPTNWTASASNPVLSDSLNLVYAWPRYENGYYYLLVSQNDSPVGAWRVVEYISDTPDSWSNDFASVIEPTGNSGDFDGSYATIAREYDGDLYYSGRPPSSNYYQGVGYKTVSLPKIQTPTATSTPSPSGVVDPAITNGLVGHWEYESGSGTTAVDSTSQNNDGNINGATWVTDTPIGEYALSFDGNSEVVVPSAPVLESPKTVFCLFKLNTFTEKSKLVYSGTSTTNNKYYLDFRNNSLRAVHNTQDAGGNKIVIEGSTSLSGDVNWHSAAFTFGGGDLKLYLDGGLEAESLGNVAQEKTTSTSVSFGSRTGGGGSDNFYNGIQTRVLFYEDVKTQTEIQSLHDQVFA
jgi:hypothetical protein